MKRMKKQFSFLEWFVWICITFYITYLFSVVDVKDVCNDARGFVIAWTLIFTAFYFANKIIKKDWHFVSLAVVLGMAFEYFIIQPLRPDRDPASVLMWIFMILAYVCMFYIPRVLLRKTFKRKS
jgi:hypothetical protein